MAGSGHTNNKTTRVTRTKQAAQAIHNRLLEHTTLRISTEHSKQCANKAATSFNHLQPRTPSTKLRSMRGAHDDTKAKLLRQRCETTWRAFKHQHRGEAELHEQILPPRCPHDQNRLEQRDTRQRQHQRECASRRRRRPHRKRGPRGDPEAET